MCQTMLLEMERGLALAARWHGSKVCLGRNMWQGQFGPGMPSK